MGSIPTTATNYSVMKKKTTSTRNEFAVPAMNRKAGKIRSRKEKRKNGKNKQQEYLKEVES